MQFARGQAGGTFTDYFPGQEETSGTSAADSSGYGHTAKLGTGATFSTDSDTGKGNVVSLNGTSTANGTASGPIVDSKGDFTVAAWAKLDVTTLADTTLAHHMRIATQSGGVRDSWGLWYDQAAGSAQGMWVFGRTTADATSGTVVKVPANVASAQLVDPGDWTLLTGVYDGAHHQLFLYVNLPGLKAEASVVRFRRRGLVSCQHPVGWWCRLRYERWGQLHPPQ